jgi:hypothetical protein
MSCSKGRSDMKSIEEIANDINEYVKISSMLEMVCKYLKIPKTASPLYNFRDSLSHYIQLYEAKDDDKKISQETSIEEHLFRGVKDIYVYILDKMKIRISTALDDAKNKNEERDFRKLLHEYKKMEIEIRKNSESAVIRVMSYFVDNLVKVIEDTKSVFKRYQIPFNANLNYKTMVYQIDT